MVIKYDNIKKHDVVFFNERIQIQVNAWPVGIYADFLHLVQLMERYGPDLRLPHSRSLGGGLFELRCRGPEGTGRAFYCFHHGHSIVILHAFIKKTMALPDSELALARKRLKQVKYG